MHRFDVCNNESFWVIVHTDGNGVDDPRILYGMRSELNTPPGGEWVRVHDGELSPEGSPGVILEDVFIHNLERQASEVRAPCAFCCCFLGGVFSGVLLGTADRCVVPGCSVRCSFACTHTGGRTQTEMEAPSHGGAVHHCVCSSGWRRIVRCHTCAELRVDALAGMCCWMLELSRCAVLSNRRAARCRYMRFAVAEEDRNYFIGYVIFGVLLWTEIAQVMQLFAGVSMNPLQVVLVKFLTRVILIGVKPQYWFMGACIIYLLFVVPVAFSIVHAR